MRRVIDGWLLRLMLRLLPHVRRWRHAEVSSSLKGSNSDGYVLEFGFTDQQGFRSEMTCRGTAMAIMKVLVALDDSWMSPATRHAE